MQKIFILGAVIFSVILVNQINVSAQAVFAYTQNNSGKIYDYYVLTETIIFGDANGASAKVKRVPRNIDSKIEVVQYGYSSRGGTFSFYVYRDNQPSSGPFAVENYPHAQAIFKIMQQYRNR